MRQHKRRGPQREQREVTVSQPSRGLRTDASPLMAVSLAAAATGGLEADKKPSSEASGTSHCKYLTAIRQGARAERCREPPSSRDRPVPTAGTGGGRRGGRARKRCKLDTKHTSGGAVTPKRRSRGCASRKETEVIQITSLLSLPRCDSSAQLCFCRALPAGPAASLGHRALAKRPPDLVLEACIKPAADLLL